MTSASAVTMAPDVDLPEVSVPIDTPTPTPVVSTRVVAEVPKTAAAVGIGVADLPSGIATTSAPAAVSAPAELRSLVEPPVAPKAAVPPADVSSPRHVATPAPKPSVVSPIAEHPMSSKSEFSSSGGSVPTAASARPKVKSGRSWATIAAAGLGIVAVAEAVVIAGMMSQSPAPMAGVTLTVPAPLPAPAVMPAAQAMNVATAPLAPGAEAAASAAPPAAAPVSSPATVATAAPAAAPASGGRFGGVKISAPIELQVFENGNFLGTTAGPIALAEGSHALDVANESLGYRARQNVAVKGGQMAALTVTLPQGKLNVNAAPWANVWIDGTAAGETPLANVALTIGSHEILFRHPQLGEQRLTAVVKADSVARVSASFQR